MDFIRRHSFVITLALVLWVFPLQTYAQFDIDLSTIWDTLNSGLQTAAYYLVVEGLGLLVWFGALILDFAINNFVIGFGDTFIKSGIGLAVNQTWVIIRDFVNMFFIFGFVYIGFKMILNSSDSNTRRWLVNILLAALLVNFSLFITKFAIDFTNQLASQIAVNGLGTTGEWDTETDLYKVNLTSEFMSRMGVSDILGIDYKVVEGGGWGYIIGTAILFLTAAFVFAAGGIILIIRFAMLNLFMMLSPIMFLSWVLPPVKDTMQRFWSAFFGRALYAPIYLLFIYFSLQIIAGLQISVTGENSSFANPNWAGTFQALNEVNGGTATGTLGTLPFFILICIFLALSISFADKLGADGGSMAVKLGRSFERKVRQTTTKAAGSATLGLVGMAGQQTLGRGARALSNTQGLQKWAANSRVGRTALGATRGVADSSFDPRRVGGVGKALGIGEGKKGGFSSRIKEREKKDEEFMKSLDDADMTNPENIRKVEERAEEIKAEGEQAKKAAEDASKGHDADKDKTSEKLASEIDDLEKSIDRFTRGIALGTQNGSLTPQEIEKLNNKMEADKVRLQQKQKLQVTSKAKEDTLKEIADLRSQENDQSLTSQERANIRDQRQQAEKEIEEIDKGLQAESTKLKAEIEKAKKQINTASSVANSEVKFANKIVFMETAKRRASGLFNAKGQASLENLQKKFGKDAGQMSTKAAISKASMELARQLAQVQKDNAEGGKKDEKKEEEGDNH